MIPKQVEREAILSAIIKLTEIQTEDSEEFREALEEIGILNATHLEERLFGTEDSNEYLLSECQEKELGYTSLNFGGVTYCFKDYSHTREELAQWKERLIRRNTCTKSFAKKMLLNLRIEELSSQIEDCR